MVHAECHERRSISQGAGTGKTKAFNYCKKPLNEFNENKLGNAVNSYNFEILTVMK